MHLALYFPVVFLSNRAFHLSVPGLVEGRVGVLARTRHLLFWLLCKHHTHTLVLRCPAAPRARVPALLRSTRLVSVDVHGILDSGSYPQWRGLLGAASGKEGRWVAVEQVPAPASWNLQEGPVSSRELSSLKAVLRFPLHMCPDTLLCASD